MSTPPDIFLMRPFRHDPRFQAFATRLKLVEYWKHYGPPDSCGLEDDKLTCRRFS